MGIIFNLKLIVIEQTRLITGEARNNRQKVARRAIRNNKVGDSKKKRLTVAKAPALYRNP
ncbi:hypothetical protein [Enterobacter sp.]|uniref:hypothetical protein n=1 Tax=Enterobacter sp. TaxID=42895 RepID=UPI00296F8D1D|nr:hypothetical protein [Enterobacter sp.]